MSTATSYSKLGYLMLKKEATAGTAVYPDTAIELLSESIVTPWDFSPASTIAGNRSVNNTPILGQVGAIEGTIEILVEPKTVGHFLTGLNGTATDSTLSAGIAFQHDFSPQNTLITYTMDVKMAGEDYVTRYFGVRIASHGLSLDGNKLKLSLGIMAQRVFSCARVTTAAGSGTALVLDQTSGLVAGSDTITLFDATDMSEHQDLTVTTVTDENILVVSTISQSLAVDDIAVIAAQVPTYDLSNEFIWSGGATVEYANGDHGGQSLAAKNNVESFSLTQTNDLEARWAATGVDVVDRMSSNILLKGTTTEGSFSQFHTDPEWLDILRSNEQTTLRFKFLGSSALEANAAAAATANIETDGVGQLTVTASTLGEAGNDFAIIFTSGNASLTATLAGKLITVNLDTVGANNTETLVASAINALSGVACPDTGTDLVDVASNLSKIFFANGRDANEVEMLSFTLPNVRLNPFNANLGQDDIINEEISFVAYRDADDAREIATRLRNGTAAY